MRNVVSWSVAALVVLFLGALPYWDLSRKYTVLNEQTVRLRELTTEHHRQVKEHEHLLVKTRHVLGLESSKELSGRIQKSCVQCHLDMAGLLRDAEEVIAGFPSIQDMALPPLPKGPPPALLPERGDFSVPLTAEDLKGIIEKLEKVMPDKIAPAPREVQKTTRRQSSVCLPNYGPYYSPFALPPITR